MNLESHWTGRQWFYIFKSTKNWFFFVSFESWRKGLHDHELGDKFEHDNQIANNKKLREIIPLELWGISVIITYTFNFYFLLHQYIWREFFYEKNLSIQRLLWAPSSLTLSCTLQSQVEGWGQWQTYLGVRRSSCISTHWKNQCKRFKLPLCSTWWQCILGVRQNTLAKLCMLHCCFGPRRKKKKECGNQIHGLSTRLAFRGL